MNGKRRVVTLVSYICALVVCASVFGAEAASLKKRENETENLRRLSAVSGFGDAMRTINDAFSAFSTVKTQEAGMFVTEDGIATSGDVKVSAENEAGLPRSAVAALCVASGRAAALYADTISYAPGAGIVRFFSSLTEAASGALDFDREAYARLLQLEEYSRRVERELLPALSDGDMALAVETENDIFSSFGGFLDPGADGQMSDVCSPREEISEREARDKAEILLGGNVTLKTAENNSSPGIYSFVCGNVSIDIAKRGGALVRLLFDRKSVGGDIGYSAALGHIEAFLSSQGLDSLSAVSLERSGDRYIGVFARRDDSDAAAAPVVVAVTAGSGRISAFDAARYYAVK